MGKQELTLRITGKNSDGEYWLHIDGSGQSAGFNLGAPSGMISSALLMAASGHTYIRLDPNTRIVTVDQLGRWKVIIDKLAPGFVYGSGPYNETLPEITGMWNEIRAIIGEVK
jgi:hypothetical protein